MIVTSLSLAARRGITLAVALIGIGVAGSAVAGPVTSYTVNQDFLNNEAGAQSNPNGSYIYGYNLSPTDPSQISTANLVHTSAFAGNAGVQGFYYPNNVVVPAIVANVTANTVVLPFATLQPGQLLLHPGGPYADGFSSPLAYADLQYTIGAAGIYNIFGRFSGLDSGGTDVHVYVNGTEQFGSSVSGGTSTAFNLSHLILNAGAKVDFLVGPGADGGIGSDSTGLFASVVAAPEPSTLASAGLAGVLGLVVHARRRRRSPLAA